MKLLFVLIMLSISAVFGKKALFRNKGKARKSFLKARGGGCNQWTGPMTPRDKQIILNSHNWYRNQIATQTNKVGPQLPFAKNMLQMYWSDAIAAKAQQWADGCKFEHSTSAFRKQPEFPTGENLYESSSSGGFQKINWAKATTQWYNEIKDFGSKSVDSMQSGGPVTGHFTQVIWANSYLIGCGLAQHKDGGWFSTLYVCEYGPVGNVVGMAIYDSSPTKVCVCQQGTSCSNTTFPGLCCPEGACDWKTQQYAGAVIPGTVPTGLVDS